jgi:hypothetical protein
MVQVTLNLDDEQTKALLKQAILEMLQEKNGLFYKAIVEVLEDLALAGAIEEGLTSEVAGRDEVFQILEGAT